MELNAESNRSEEGLQLRLEVFDNQSESHLQCAGSRNWACKKPKTRIFELMIVLILSGCLDRRSKCSCVHLCRYSPKGFTVMNTSPGLEISWIWHSKNEIMAHLKNT